MSERTRRLTVAFGIFYGLGEMGVNGVWAHRDIINRSLNAYRRAAWEEKFAPIRAEREAKASEEFFKRVDAGCPLNANPRLIPDPRPNIILDPPDYTAGPLV